MTYDEVPTPPPAKAVAMRKAVWLKEAKRRLVALRDRLATKPKAKPNVSIRLAAELVVRAYDRTGFAPGDKTWVESVETLRRALAQTVGRPRRG